MCQLLCWLLALSWGPLYPLSTWKFIWFNIVYVVLLSIPSRPWVSWDMQWNTTWILLFHGWAWIQTLSNIFFSGLFLVSKWLYGPIEGLKIWICWGNETSWAMSCPKWEGFHCILQGFINLSRIGNRPVIWNWFLIAIHCFIPRGWEEFCFQFL